jgi:hypothetical protein
VRCAPDATTVSEDLVANARTALRAARTHCASGCDWYHALYPVLRLLDLAATPQRHAAFFRDALAGAERVLIAGAADTGVLCQLLASGRPRAIAVIDRCETPLVVCRAHAELAGVPLVSERLDLLEPTARAPGRALFDLVCTHSLLGMVPPAQRVHAAAALCAQLRPGGRLVSTTRIDPAAPVARLAAAAAERFCARVEAGAAAWCDALGVEPAQLSSLARRYAAEMTSWPFESGDALARCLEAGGFAIEQLDVVEIAGTLSRDASAAGTNRPATYAEFVATRGGGVGSRPSSSSAK